MSEQLKPCPFCGGDAKQAQPEQPHGGMVHCVSCGAEAFGPKWNRRKDASDAAIAAARAEGVREGMLKAAGYADNWLATFGQAAIKHTPAQEYACDAVADIADAIRAAAEAQP